MNDRVLKRSLAVLLAAAFSIAGCSSVHPEGALDGNSESILSSLPSSNSSGNRIVDSFNFSQGDLPENIIVTNKQNSQFAAALLDNTIIWSDGHREQVAEGYPDAVTLGLVEDAEDRLYVAVRSQDQSVSGVWRRGNDGRWSRFIAVAPEVGLNGLTFGDDGTLYAADSVNGQILSAAPGRTDFDLWLDDPSLKPTSNADLIAASGVNGLKIFQDNLYASNTAQRNVLRIPLGGPKMKTPESVISGYPVDDFAIDSSGSFYLAVHPDNTVVRVDPSGERTTLATAQDGLDGPTAVAVAQAGVLTTNLGFLGTTHKPSIVFVSSPVEEPVLPKPVLPTP